MMGTVEKIRDEEIFYRACYENFKISNIARIQDFILTKGKKERKKDQNACGPAILLRHLFLLASVFVDGGFSALWVSGSATNFVTLFLSLLISNLN